MSSYEITTIVLAVVIVLTGVSWVGLIASSKSLIKNAKELRDKYQKAISNGVISDAEKAGIAQEAIEVIEDMIDLWQGLVNVFYAIKKAILRK